MAQRNPYIPPYQKNKSNFSSQRNTQNSSNENKLSHNPSYQNPDSGNRFPHNSGYQSTPFSSQRNTQNPDNGNRFPQNPDNRNRFPQNQENGNRFQQNPDNRFPPNSGYQTNFSAQRNTQNSGDGGRFFSNAGRENQSEYKKQRISNDNHNNYNHNNYNKPNEVDNSLKRDEDVMKLYSETFTFEGFKIMKNEVNRFNEFKTAIGEIKELKDLVMKSENDNKDMISKLETKYNKKFVGDVQKISQCIADSGNANELLSTSNKLAEYKNKIDNINILLSKINELRPRLISPISLISTHTDLGFLLIEDDSQGWNIYNEISDYKLFYRGDFVTVYSKRKFSATINKYNDIILTNEKNKDVILPKIEFILQVANIIIANNNIKLTKTQVSSSTTESDDDIDDDYDDDIDDEWVTVSHKRR